MRLTLTLFAVLAVSGWGVAQEPPGVAESFATLADQPATHTGFAFDHTMMQVAQAMLQSGSGMDEKRSAAALTGISVDTYRYAQPAVYPPHAMEVLLAAYHAAGWKHLVNRNGTVASTAEPSGAVDDLWLHFTGTDVDGITVLLRTPKEMTVIRVTGDLRPLDLVHLSGHFGIPKVDPNALMVPDGK
jgi:hypothetical protein